MSEQTMTNQEWHLKQAKDCFNGTWDFIDLETRTKEQEMDMIHMAHASRYHWAQCADSKPINRLRGEWQISRVYALVGQGESALYHGQACLEGCKEHGIGDFDLAFALEAVARGYKVLGDEKNKEHYKKQALKAAESIKEKADLDYTLSEISTI